MTMPHTLRERPMHSAPPLAPPSLHGDVTMPDPLLPQIRRLEAIAARSWPSRETAFDGTWAVRLCDHDSKRQNCVVPLDPGDRRDLETRIAAVRSRYLSAERRPTFRLTPLAHPAIDDALGSLGWEAVDRTHVMTVDLPVGQPGRSAATEGCRHRWVETLTHMNGIEEHRAAGLAGTIARIQRGGGPTVAEHGPAYLHVAHEDDDPAAAALAVQLGEEVGLMEVFTDPKRRGRGHARRIVTGAIEAARERGATRAWLQVAASNTPAIALYESLGFETLYDYRYRVAPVS